MSEPTRHPLPGRVAFVLALTTFVGVEIGTRALYDTRDSLSKKAAAFDVEARAEDKNLVILGTCLPEQHIREDVLQDRIQAGWVVHNLGTEATSTLDWYLALENELDAERIQALVVAYGKRDLLAAISPWESRVTELASWSDMPDLAGWVCHDSDCTTDLWLRKASATWRYRVRIANRAWASIGALPEEAQVAPPPSGNTDDAAQRFYLERLLTTAKERGIPTLLAPLPARPAPDDQTSIKLAEEQAYHMKIDPIVQAAGATVLTLPAHPTTDFTDETHLTEAGSIALTKELAAVLREQWGLEEPPETVIPTGPQGAPLGADGKPTEPAPVASTVVGPPSGGVPAPPTEPPSQPAVLAPASGAIGPADGGLNQPPPPTPTAPVMAPASGAHGPAIPAAGENGPAFIPPPDKPQGPPLQ